MSLNALDPNEIIFALKDLPNWKLDEEGTKLICEIKFQDFREAIGFIVRIAFECEDQDHHPEIYNVYNTVKLGLTTHEAGDFLTDKDIQLARKIDELIVGSSH
ncbi:MAG: 4a-hydroxytetrahydrobiopterin dehydratase [Opitutae bacterium]|nr:4a-hydroxytetrahydrobiopterin dehydratase [Opitutae bacterium]MBT4224664.1 4a-hydroxytetrahydrobiopterin dehydratase [Opitutae bacterium]MBT5378140.1 4a-hydroxytetrahydrobiopterin dehydratase [Opitutae bacterium]MBT5692453.1 4a-hydroxytetrahydrobiopterin dehydratase [Opitutae bacterium]